MIQLTQVVVVSLLVGVGVLSLSGNPYASVYFGLATFNVVDKLPNPAPGSKAVSVPTPTKDDHRGVEPYCTRTDTAVVGDPEQPWVGAKFTVIWSPAGTAARARTSLAERPAAPRGL